MIRSLNQYREIISTEDKMNKIYLKKSSGSTNRVPQQRSQLMKDLPFLKKKMKDKAKTRDTYVILLHK